MTILISFVVHILAILLALAFGLGMYWLLYPFTERRISYYFARITASVLGWFVLIAVPVVLRQDGWSRDGSPTTFEDALVGALVLGGLLGIFFGKITRSPPSW